jgi:subtilisin family serine protease
MITSTIPERDNGTLLGKSGGTSQASPHVTGSVALLQEIAAEYDVRLTPEQVRDYLINNADIITDGDDEADTVANTNLDYPRINIYQSAIALREDLENQDAPDLLTNSADTGFAEVSDLG